MIPDALLSPKRARYLNLKTFPRPDYHLPAVSAPGAMALSREIGSFLSATPMTSSNHTKDVSSVTCE